MGNKKEIIEETGANYDKIIFEDDYVPRDVYINQIKTRDKIIEKFLSGKKYHIIVDVGSGTGFHSNTLRKYADIVIATDLSFGALKDNKKKNPECQFVVCDINQLPFKKGSVDVIWIAGVLHHVPDSLDTAIKNLSYILRTNGIAIIDEPNKYNLINHINMKLSKADPTGDEKPLSLKNVTNIFNKNDCDLVESKYYGFFSPLASVLKEKNIGNIFSRLDILIEKSFLRHFAFRWYISLLKR